MDRDSFYLGHILAAIDEIESYVSGIDYTDFLENTMMQSAVIKQIEIIGEAARNLSDNIRNDYSNIDWPAIIGMRHKLAHDYFEIDLTFVWDTAKNDVGVLKREVQPILNEIRNNTN